MSDNTRKATKKRPIETVTIQLTVTANRINENGTFSGLKVQKITGPKGIAASMPPQGGGSIYLKTDTLDGVEFREGEEAGTVQEKKKLF